MLRLKLALMTFACVGRHGIRRRQAGSIPQSLPPKLSPLLISALFVIVISALFFNLISALFGIVQDALAYGDGPGNLEMFREST